MKEKLDWNELNQLKEYLLNPGTEKAKDHLAFPLFKKLFGNKFKKESDAAGADAYIEGKLLVELKSNYDNYLKGFYQALHYAKLGLTFSAICIVARKFIALWKVNTIPDHAKRLSAEADANIAPNDVGLLNARHTTRPPPTERILIADSASDCVGLPAWSARGKFTIIRDKFQIGNAGSVLARTDALILRVPSSSL